MTQKSLFIRQFKPLVVTGWLAAALALAAYSSVVTAAPPANDAAQVELQAALLPEVEIRAEKAGGYAPGDLQLKATAHQITITISGSVLNNGGETARLAQASRIVSAVAEAIFEKPGFSQIPVIHLDYVTVAGSKGKVVQKIDYFQTPAGVFVLHKT